MQKVIVSLAVIIAGALFLNFYWDAGALFDNLGGPKSGILDTEFLELVDLEAGEQDNMNQLSYLEQTVVAEPDGKKTVTNPLDILVLVNEQRNLPADYVPYDLVKPNILFSFKEELPKKLLRKDAARGVEKLFKKAAEDKINILGASGYRSYKRQNEIFTYWARIRGEETANKTSAYPGQSEHQTGLALDVTSPSIGFRLEESFGETIEGKWLAINAPDFGFIIRYPHGKEDVTGYSYEPWHLRYVGVEVAREVSRKGITLEEFLMLPGSATLVENVNLTYYLGS